MMVVSTKENSELAKSIAKKLKVHYSGLQVKHFPDGELYTRFTKPVKNKKIILIQTLYPPNEPILISLLAAYGAKDLGAKKVYLVAPYMAYMRQDKVFNPGETISSEIFGELLSAFDKIITIDPHLHRHKTLREIFSTKTKKLTANNLIADFVKNNFKNPVIIGPDMESNQWAERIANKTKSKSSIFEKTRFNSKKVSVDMKNKLELKNREVIIIDDIISTGHTILEAIKKIEKFKPRSINVIGIHGIFTDKKVYESIKKRTKNLITTNTIKSKHSKIDVSSLIAESLK